MINLGPNDNSEWNCKAEHNFLQPSATQVISYTKSSSSESVLHSHSGDVSRRNAWAPSHPTQFHWGGEVSEVIRVKDVGVGRHK